MKQPDLDRRYMALAVRLAVRRVLASGTFVQHARELAGWAAAHDGATRAAELVEGLAG